MPFCAGLIPMWLFGFLAWTGRRGTERSLDCRFPSVEAAVARLAPRPWLMIHGERDTYIGPEIARNLFDHGEDPKELWLVPDAKHNRCRETAPDAYAAQAPRFSRTIRSAPPAGRADGGCLEAQRIDERLRSSAGRRRRSREKWRHPSQADRESRGDGWP